MGRWLGSSTLENKLCSNEIKQLAQRHIALSWQNSNTNLSDVTSGYSFNHMLPCLQASYASLMEEPCSG